MVSRPVESSYSPRYAKKQGQDVAGKGDSAAAPVEPLLTRRRSAGPTSAFSHAQNGADPEVAYVGRLRIPRCRRRHQDAAPSKTSRRVNCEFYELGSITCASCNAKRFEESAELA